MLCAGHLYIVWICWRISAPYIHIYVRDVSERELPIQLLLLLGRQSCSLDYNMYTVVYIYMLAALFRPTVTLLIHHRLPLMSIPEI